MRNYLVGKELNMTLPPGGQLPHLEYQKYA